MFEDDDELFMNIEYENSSAPTSSQSPTVQKKVQITTTVSKRVKYEDSSDEDSSFTGKSKESNRQSTSIQASAKPIGIRKRNNIF